MNIASGSKSIAPSSPRRFAIIGGSLCTGAMLVLLGLEARYSYSLPTSPDLRSGRMDSLRVMRFTVYGTPREASTQYWVHTICTWAFILGFATLLWAKRRMPARRPDPPLS